MKRILVPIDFSEHSEYALEVAAQLAKFFGAEIVALHMMGLSQAVITKDDSKEVMEAMFYMKLAEKRFNEFLDQPYLNDLKVHTTVQNYKEFQEINSVAKEFDCDLIVMGSHGSSGIQEMFVGSNTEKVVRHSEIPVMVIKHHDSNLKLENIVFASNFDKEFVKSFLNAKRLANTLGANLQLVYVNTPGDGFRSTQEMNHKILQFLLDANVDNEYSITDVAMYNAYTVEEGVFEYSNHINADAIAMPTHGRKGLAHFFTGSISEDLVNHSDLPVITFKI